MVDANATSMPFTRKKKKYQCILVLMFTVAITISTFVKIISIHSIIEENGPVHFNMSFAVSQKRNETLCAFLRLFVLSDKKNVTICSYENHTRVDIREFVNDRATIKGIWLNLSEWYKLLQIWGVIQDAIYQSENKNNP